MTDSCWSNFSSCVAVPDPLPFKNSHRVSWRDMDSLRRSFMVAEIIFQITFTSTMPLYYPCPFGERIMLFSIVNEIYEHSEAGSAISLFQMNELFSHHFRGFKLEISDPRNSRNPFRFPALSNTYSNDCRYNPVSCPNKLIYQRQINGLKKRLIVTLPNLSRSRTVCSNPSSSSLYN